MVKSDKIRLRMGEPPALLHCRERLTDRQFVRKWNDLIDAEPAARATWIAESYGHFWRCDIRGGRAPTSPTG